MGGDCVALPWQVVMPSPLPAHVQMALDEVLLNALIAGRRGSMLRFWEWSEPALILGSGQVLANEVDLQQARELGFAVARRISGGGTMIAEPGRTLTYSIYAPQSLVSGLSLVESFAFFDAWAVDCFRELGVPADYRPINDIVSPEGKIGGAAQARRRGHVLHHTTIAYSMDPALVPRLIRTGRERVSPRGVRSAEKAVSPLERWLALSRDQVVSALAACFSRRHATTPGQIDDEELAAARDLAAHKYGTQAWIDRVS